MRSYCRRLTLTPMVRISSPLINSTFLKKIIENMRISIPCVSFCHFCLTFYFVLECGQLTVLWWFWVDSRGTCMFRFLIHFELVLCKWCEVRIQLPFFCCCMWIYSFPSIICWRYRPGLCPLPLQAAACGYRVFPASSVEDTALGSPPLPPRLLCGFGQGAPCCAVGPCWLFILSIAMCTCLSQTPL